MKKLNSNFYAHDRSITSLLFRMEQSQFMSFFHNKKIEKRLEKYGLISKISMHGNFGNSYELTERARFLLRIRGL